uniref:Fe2OG dioxygenase domain-containing protein n=1 Tax=Ditylum brightwellii TaxID=49249 RepID=A0A7S2EJ16_9STRA|mmetsp:Transcript_31276/g.46649  ORF Transcript_31276/g.46649 Transcript_31276/m.46649 type:complete len:449 (+) Transcript_31276:82-1428(+)
MKFPARTAATTTALLFLANSAFAHGISGLQCPELEHLTDNHPDCQSWSRRGECEANPGYMLINCQKSCFSCIESDVDFGEKQKLYYQDECDNNGNVKDLEDKCIKPAVVDELAVKDVIQQSIRYIKNEVMIHEKYSRVRSKCRNDHDMCSIWASVGKCEMSSPQMIDMKKECAPACQTCELLDECGPHFLNSTNVWKPGDLNQMFEQIVDNAKKKTKENISGIEDDKVTAHSRPYHYHTSEEAGDSGESDQDYHDGPWVLTFDNFLSSKECDILISLGDQLGRTRSLAGDKYSSSRTSSHVWCTESCDLHPTVREIIQRISKVTGVPEVNFEHIQLLKYEEGQFYKTHHDYISEHRNMPEGVRILTMFFYLNDVEDGGGTRFRKLDDLTFTPRKGMALLWPSVLDENPHSIDQRTSHEAMPVLKGKKYAANLWLHIRDFRSVFDKGCM